MRESVILQWANQAMTSGIYPNSAFPPSRYYRFLKVAATNMQPRLSVELGVCGGGGSLHLCLGWPAGKVIGIDSAVEYPDNIKHIEREFPNFQFLWGDSCLLAPKIYNDYGRVDILFIDTIHTYERTMAEWEAWYHILSSRAIVCLDDLRRPGMSQAWRELPGHKIRLDMLHDGAEGEDGGFGVIWQ